MEQSLADQAASIHQLFGSNLSSPSNNSFSFSLQSLTGLPGVLSYSPPTMSQAAVGSHYQTNPTLSSPDPPAAGPNVAALPSSAAARLRQQVLNAAAAQAAAAPAMRRNTRARGRAGPGPATPGLHAAAVAASAAAAHEGPRRSQRTRKRAPAAASMPPSSSSSDDPPAKKQKRANLKSAPPANAKSDDDDDSKPEESQVTASCCICMDEPKPADLASISGCDHLFCFECIEKWAERENSCPLCKVRFTKIDRVNKSKKKKGEAAKNTKKVKAKDQRSDIAPGAALEGLLASFASSANFPPHRVARLIFSGMGPGNPFAVLPASSALRNSRAAGAAAAERANALEDSLFSSDTDEDEDNSFLPSVGASSFADLFRSVPMVSHRGPGIIVGGGLGGPRGISLHTFADPPQGRSYASNSGDRTAGRQATNPLEIEDDSEDEEDIEVVQVTRPV